MKSLDIVGNNLLYFFKDGKLDVFDKKIIDELYEKYSMNLIDNDYIIEPGEKENNINNPEMEINKTDNNNKEHNNDKTGIKNIIQQENVIDLNTLKNIIDFLIKRRSQNDFFCLLYARNT